MSAIRTPWRGAGGVYTGRLALGEVRDTMGTTEAVATALAARLYGFAAGSGDADSIPGEVLWALTTGPVSYDAANAAMNAEADKIRDSHAGETSDTIREDDRANLFTNVAGYMLTHDTGGMDDAAIVGAAIADRYSADPGEVRSWI